MSNHCIVDASVGIKLLLPEAGTELVEQIFAGLSDEPPLRLYVPELFYIECANILWKYVRRFEYPIEDARGHLSDLRQLDLDVIPTEDLLLMAFDLALEYEITAYDACYVALAGLLELPLITADRRLANKMRGSDILVRLLDEAAPPNRENPSP